jgi:hypothetical protein
MIQAGLVEEKRRRKARKNDNKNPKPKKEILGTSWNFRKIITDG